MIYVTTRRKGKGKTRVAGARVRSHGSADMGVVLIEAHGASKGTAVRVREGYLKAEFCGKHGTVRELWGDSEHAAVEVLMEDGRLELFWLPNLDVVEGDVAV